jgi:general secretion pathway protein C
MAAATRAVMFALRRWIWLVPVVTVAACAFLGTRTIYALLAAGRVTLEPATRHARAASAPARVKDPGDIVDRNIFCSTCGQDQPKEQVGDASLPRTTLPLVLVAIFAGPGAATISDTKTGQAGFYAVGERIPGAGEVRWVGAQTVGLWNDASKRVERLDLVATAPPPPPSRPTAKAAPPAGPDGELLAEADRSVKRVDDRHFQVERGLMDKLLSDPMALARAARVSPAVDGGRAVGFRLAGVRDGSLVTKIGLQNGDVIQSINGLELTSPDNVLDAYTRLRSVSNLAITVARGGAPIKLEVAIR